MIRPDLNLSEDAIKRLEQDLRMEISDSESAKGDLPQRWERNRASYHGSTSAQAPEVVSGQGGYVLPLAKPSLNRIIGNIYSNLTQLSPTCQVLDMSGGGANVESIEITLQNLADRCKWRREIKPTIAESLNSNAAFLRVAIESDDNDIPCGIRCDSIKPEEIIAYPAYKKDSDSLITYGFKTLEPLVFVTKKIEDGDYLDINPNALTTGRSSANTIEPDAITGDFSSVSNYKDAPIEVADLISYRDLSVYDESKPKEFRLYAIRYATISGRILSIKPYGYIKDGEVIDYDLRNIVDFRTMPLAYGFWTNDSTANGLQDIQNIGSAILTTIIQGAQMSAFPVFIVKNGSLGTKFLMVKPGIIFDDMPAHMEVEVVKTSFDPSVLPQMLELVREIADGITDVGRLASNQALPSGASATEAAILGQQQQAAQDEYMDCVTPSVERVWEILFMFLKAHYYELVAAFGPLIVASYEEVMSIKPKFLVTGSTSSANPSALMTKYQALMSMAMNPQSNIDFSKAEEKYVQAMQLPFTFESIELTPQQKMARALAMGGHPLEDIHAAATGQINGNQFTPGEPPIGGDEETQEFAIHNAGGVQGQIA